MHIDCSSYLPNSFLLFFLFWSGSVKNTEEVGCLCSHSGVNVCLQVEMGKQEKMISCFLGYLPNYFSGIPIIFLEYPITFLEYSIVF